MGSPLGEDVYQSCLNQNTVLSSIIPDHEGETSSLYNGQTETRGNLNDIDLSDLDTEQREALEMNLPDENYLAGMDQIYDAVKNSRKNRLKGLDALHNDRSIEAEADISPATLWRWENVYEEAGLYNGEETTEAAEILLESEPSKSFAEYFEDGHVEDPLENVASAYTTLRSDQQDGQKMRAFLLHSIGMPSDTVEEMVDMEYEALKQTRQDWSSEALMESGAGEMTGKGYRLAETVVGQIDEMKDIAQGQNQYFGNQ